MTSEFKRTCEYPMVIYGRDTTCGDSACEWVITSSGSKISRCKYHPVKQLELRIFRSWDLAQVASVMED